MTRVTGRLWIHRWTYRASSDAGSVYQPLLHFVLVGIELIRLRNVVQISAIHVVPIPKGRSFGNCVRVHSYRAKTAAKAKSSFDVCHFSLFFFAFAFGFARYELSPNNSPFSPTFFSLQCRFLTKMAKIIGWRPLLLVGAPPSRKTWIPYWVTEIKLRNYTINNISRPIQIFDFIHNDKIWCLSIIFLPPANEVCEGYVFTHVCHSVHRGGSASVHTRIPHPPGTGTPRTRHPPEQAPPPPGPDTLPGPDTPPPGSRTPTPLHSACWEIRSTSGRYASYWNAILLYGSMIFLFLTMGYVW